MVSLSITKHKAIRQTGPTLARNQNSVRPHKIKTTKKSTIKNDKPARFQSIATLKKKVVNKHEAQFNS